MTNIKLITVTNAPEHAGMLIKSAEKQGWDLIVIQAEWKGFGTKLIETYNYLKAHPEVERFVFADAFDVIVLGTQEEFDEKLISKDRMLLSTEKGLWPPILHPFRSRYTIEGDFNFINSGLYYSPSKLFIKLIESNMPSNETDDQYWMNMIWLLYNSGYNTLGSISVLDRYQCLFNSHSFVSEGEYGYENNRVQIMGNEPIFIHFNGKTVDENFNERIRI